MDKKLLITLACEDSFQLGRMCVCVSVCVYLPTLIHIRFFFFSSLTCMLSLRAKQGPVSASLEMSLRAWDFYSLAPLCNANTPTDPIRILWTAEQHLWNLSTRPWSHRHWPWRYLPFMACNDVGEENILQRLVKYNHLIKSFHLILGFL